MRCPTCNDALHQASVHSQRGETFVSQHCFNCLGTWFDDIASLDRLSEGDAKRLRYLIQYPKRTYITPSPLLCPFDRTPLTPTHPQAGASAPFHTCPICHGVWIGQKALESYKSTGTGISVHSFIPRSTGTFIVLFLIFSSIATLTIIRRSGGSINVLEPRAEDRYDSSPFQHITLQARSDTSVTISFQTTTPATTSISIGESQTFDQTFQVSDTPVTSHRIVLSGLDPALFYTFFLSAEDVHHSFFQSSPITFSPGE